jgi:predicted Zn-dependent protease
MRGFVRGSILALPFIVILKHYVMRRMTFISNICITVSLVLLSACAVNPVTGKKQIVLMSQEQEIAMGKQADPEIIAFFGLYEDPEMQRFINEKGQAMAAASHRPKLDYQFKIVDSPVVNAFALPGGYVYFTRGIMAHFNNEAEFAGVLGHEIGHVTARHSVIQQRNAMLGQIGLMAGVLLVPELADFAEPLTQGLQLALMSFGRDAERQSDKLGVEYSSKIGYDASEMAGFFKTLERQSALSGAAEIPEFLSTHPSPSERNETVAKLAAEQKRKSRNATRVGRESYLKMIDGLVVGEDPKQGFVENGVFYHPGMKFLFPVPAGWKLQNSPQQVQMASESGDAIMIFMLAPGATLEEAANTSAQQFGLSILDSRKESINGLPSLLFVADQKQEQGTIRVLSTLIQFQGHIFNMMGVTQAQTFTNHEGTFLSTSRQFRELTDSEKLNRKPDVVRIRTLPQSMTLENAFRHFNVPSEKFQELAVLNGMELNERVGSGEMIKVVAR